MINCWVVSWSFDKSRKSAYHVLRSSAYSRRSLAYYCVLSTVAIDVYNPKPHNNPEVGSQLVFPQIKEKHIRSTLFHSFKEVFGLLLCTIDRCHRCVRTITSPKTIPEEIHYHISFVRYLQYHVSLRVRSPGQFCRFESLGSALFAMSEKV